MLSAMAGTMFPLTVQAGNPTKKIRGKAKNIIFMVADGMSAGVPSMAELFSRRVRGRGTHWYELQQHPETTHGYFETHSLSSPVTDSSAGSSAGCWSKSTQC